MSHQIVPIVEGHGDVEAVPILLRRIASELGIHDLEVTRPIRCPRHKLLKTGELERFLELAVQKSSANGKILILIDAETDCPKDLAPELLARALRARPGIHVEIVLAKMEYEAWFLGAIKSIGVELPAVEELGHEFNPENIQGAKEKLEKLLGTHYSETIDQPAMTAQFDLDEARHGCPSFDKCWRSVESLLADPKEA